MQKLTKKQEKINYLLNRDFLTQKQISSRLKISKQAVNKCIKIIQQKGHISFIKNKRLTNVGVTPKPSQPFNNSHFKKKVRLHNQHLVIKILFKDNNYNIFRSKVTNFKIEGNTIKLNRENVEIYSNTSFFDENTNDVKKQSMEYWINLIVRLQNDLKIVLYKDKVNNIKVVREHYSEVNNELAEDYNDRKEKLSLKDPKDGKEWLKIDNSFNLNELETTHPNKAQNDMNIVKGFFDDLRESPVKLSDLSGILCDTLKLIRESADVNKETAHGLKCVTDILISNLPKENNVTAEEEITDTKVPDYIN